MKSLAAKAGQLLAAYGGWGILATSLLDSTFVPMPGFNDLLLLHVSSRRPALALVYALQCTLGSLLGSYVMYGLGKAGGSLLRRGRAATTVESKDGKVSAARRWLERNDFVSLLVLSLLPPPAPFKVFVATAGALRVNPLRFGLALLVGRGVRFVAEGLLGAHYGAQAETYVRRHVGWVSLLFAAVVILGTVVYQRLQRLKRGPEGTHRLM